MFLKSKAINIAAVTNYIFLAVYTKLKHIAVFIKNIYIYIFMAVFIIMLWKNENNVLYS